MTVFLTVIARLASKFWKELTLAGIVLAFISGVWLYHSSLIRKINRLEDQLDTALTAAEIFQDRYHECQENLDWCAGRTKEFLRHVEEYMIELEALDHAPVPKEIRTYVEREIISEVCEEAVDQAFDVALEYYDEGS